MNNYQNRAHEALKLSADLIEQGPLSKVTLAYMSIGTAIALTLLDIATAIREGHQNS